MEEKTKKEDPRYYAKLYGSVFIVLLAVVVFSFNSGSKEDVIRVSFDPAPTRHYIKTGSSNTPGVLRVQPTMIAHVTVVPTVANGGVLDISGLGFTTIANIQVSVTRNTAVPNDVPSVAVKSFTNTSIVYNLIQGNNAVVAILGINVLSGMPNAFVTTPSDCTLRFQITGY